MASSHPLPPSCRSLPALAAALDRRSASRLAWLLVGAILARGRRTVTSWIRAAGLSGEYRPCYTAVAAAGKKADGLAARLAHQAVKPLVAGTERLTLALDDTPTPRYGRHVQGAGTHHNPFPRPGRRAVRVRPRVGGPRAAGHPPEMGHRRPPAAGPAVRPGHGPGRHRPQAPATVPDQADAGRRAGAVGGHLARSPRQTHLGGGRRGLRQGALPQAPAVPRGDGGQPAPQGRGPVGRPRDSTPSPARPPPGVRRPTDRPGQAGRAAAGVDDRDLHPVRRARRRRRTRRLWPPGVRPGAPSGWCWWPSGTAGWRSSAPTRSPPWPMSSAALPPGSR